MRIRLPGEVRIDAQRERLPRRKVAVDEAHRGPGALYKLLHREGGVALLGDQARGGREQARTGGFGLVWRRAAGHRY